MAVLSHLDQVFKETGSGANLNRTCRCKVMALVKARRIDMARATELSRWGRSTLELLERLHALHSRAVPVVEMNGMTFNERGTIGLALPRPALQSRKAIGAARSFRWSSSASLKF
ncbi:MAG: recombinase family protein [Bauldia litoralis]